jgi:hypothetical protein
MRVATQDLSAHMLRWAVMVAQGWTMSAEAGATIAAMRQTGPAESWAKGGPIIERWFICINGDDGSPDTAPSWTASIFDDGEFKADGPTALLAAMRCFVAWKLGEQVEIPAQFLEKK